MNGFAFAFILIHQISVNICGEVDIIERWDIMDDYSMNIESSFNYSIPVNQFFGISYILDKGKRIIYGNCLYTAGGININTGNTSNWIIKWCYDNTLNTLTYEPEIKIPHSLTYMEGNGQQMVIVSDTIYWISLHNSMNSMVYQYDLVSKNYGITSELKDGYQGLKDICIAYTFHENFVNNSALFVVGGDMENSDEYNDKILKYNINNGKWDFVNETVEMSAYNVSNIGRKSPGCIIRMAGADTDWLYVAGGYINKQNISTTKMIHKINVNDRGKDIEWFNTYDDLTFNNTEWIRMILVTHEGNNEVYVVVFGSERIVNLIDDGGNVYESEAMLKKPRLNGIFYYHRQSHFIYAIGMFLLFLWSNLYLYMY